MQISFLRISPYAVIPTRADSGSAGWDLSAPAQPESEFLLHPGERRLIKLGFAMEIIRPEWKTLTSPNWERHSMMDWFPDGFQFEIRPRSGNALKKGLTVLNTPGTIDESWRGELGVILYNAGTESIEIHPTDRIAQIILMPYYIQEWIEVNKLSETDRGESGFGSSGGMVK